MITGAILLLIASVLSFFALLLPVPSSFPVGPGNAFSWLVTESFRFNYIFPIDTMWSIIGLMMPILIAYFSWNGINWLISVVRGS